MINKKSSNLVIIFIILITGIISLISPLFVSDTQLFSQDSQDSGFNKFIASSQGNIDYDEQELFWFIHITDTQFIWSANESIALFYQLLNETFQAIDPLFIYNTGDLVDANNGAQQDTEEWKLYEKALKDNSMNSSIYIDIVGNHDAANDPGYNHYLNYSMIGSSYNTLQYSFNKSFSFWNIYEFGLFGFLNTTELDWYENELEKYQNYDRIFVFGHHPHKHPPPFLINSSLSSNGKNFFDLNEEFEVSYYLSGHVHFNSVYKENNFLTMTTSNFLFNDGTYRIIALDHNQLSMSTEYVGKWPQGIITNPSSESPIILNKNRLRTLAWDPNGIYSVEFAIYSSNGETQITKWTPLLNINTSSPLWERNFDSQLYGKYMLKVKIEGGSGEVIKEIIITSIKGWNIEFLIILVFSIIGLISISILGFYDSRDHIGKFKIANRL
ncbi:MAG: metallophosphoesterase [Promethearchaeota archaeon]|jgi:hypothetical protein